MLFCFFFVFFTCINMGKAGGWGGGAGFIGLGAPALWINPCKLVQEDNS